MKRRKLEGNLNIRRSGRKTTTGRGHLPRLSVAPNFLAVSRKCWTKLTQPLAQQFPAAQPCLWLGTPLPCQSLRDERGFRLL